MNTRREELSNAFADEYPLNEPIRALEKRIAGLYQELEPLEAKRHRWVKARVRTLQACCAHNWKCVGRDSHKHHYNCTKCGAFEAC